MREVLGLLLAGVVMAVGLWMLFVILTYALIPFGGIILGLLSG